MATTSEPFPDLLGVAAALGRAAADPGGWGEVAEAPAVRALARLAPLMRQALDVNRMLVGHRLDAEALRRGAEPEGAAVMLLCPRGGILHANAPAEALLAEGSRAAADPLGRLRLADAGAAERLARALRPGVLGRVPGGMPRAALAFELGRGERRLVARLMPVPGDLLDRWGTAPLLLGRTPVLLVVLAPPQSPGEEAARVARALGLTGAEAAVALLLAEGATIAEAAEARGVSAETVRSQVKAALAKTGERRQAGLVARVERARRG